MTHGASTRRQHLERRVLLGPNWLCRAAASRASDPAERWMLGQPRAVRESYVLEVLDRVGDPVLRQQVWMMRQPRELRERYIREILEPALSSEGRSGGGA